MTKVRVLIAMLICSFFFWARSTTAQWTYANWPGQSATSNSTSLFGFTDDSVYASNDDGHVWTAIYNGLRSYYHNNYYIRAAYATESSLFAYVNDSVLFRSMDNGAHWDSSEIGLPIGAISLLTSNKTALFGGGGSAQNVYRSTDNGDHWVDVSQGIPSTSQVVVIQGVGSEIFVGTAYPRAIFGSKDGGTSWTELDQGLPDASISALAALGTTLFAGLIGATYDTADDVFRSTDSGTSWTQSSKGMSLDDSAFQFAVSGSRIFAAMDQGGVYSSSDSGQTWAAYNDFAGRPTPLIQSILTTSKSVFAGGGRRPLTDFTAAVAPGATPSAIQLYPNPTTGVLSVRADDVGHVSVENLLGQSVLDLGNLHSSDFTIDLSKLPAGVYFARFEFAGGAVVSRKIVKE